MNINNALLLITIVLFACSSPETNKTMKQANQPAIIPGANFIKEINGQPIQLFTLQNNQGTTCQITNYGGRVVSLWTKDQNGEYDDIVLGYDSIQGYLNSNEIYYGALIGRYGNRIANGQFTIDDQTYQLAKNNGDNHLHGGKLGFNNVVWTATLLSENGLQLTYLSKDGEEGYPGNLAVSVIYELTDANELGITYQATTDKATPVNLSHHSFFNLKGAGNGTINDHVLQINASHYTPVDEGLIPLGEIATVEGTPFDFREPTSIGSRIEADNKQLKVGLGYDHNFVLDGAGMRLAATVYEPHSGRTMEVYTDEPGLQFYGGNFLKGRDTGKLNKPYEYRSAFCLETQHYPDSPNQTNFPSTILRPGETYTSTCKYVFGIKEAE